MFLINALNVPITFLKYIPALSTLVQALTGIDPDRLIEEKKRGLTIDLGFAWMDLPDSEVVGIVDVPGHIDFIKKIFKSLVAFECYHRC